MDPNLGDSNYICVILFYCNSLKDAKLLKLRYIGEGRLAHQSFLYRKEIGRWTSKNYPTFFSTLKESFLVTQNDPYFSEIYLRSNMALHLYDHRGPLRGSPCMPPIASNKCQCRISLDAYLCTYVSHVEFKEMLCCMSISLIWKIMSHVNKLNVAGQISKKTVSSCRF